MNKEKIVLADGTKIEIEDGASESRVQIICTSIDDFKKKYEKLTKENLSAYQIETKGGQVCANLKEKYVDDINLKPTAEGFLATFCLANVDEVKAQVEAQVKAQVEAAIDEYTEQLIEEGFI